MIILLVIQMCTFLLSWARCTLILPVKVTSLFKSVTCFFNLIAPLQFLIIVETWLHPWLTVNQGCSQERKSHFTKEKERATCAGNCRRVSVQQREVRKTRGSARTEYWKFRGRRRWSTLHRNPSPPQLQYTSYHSWAALSIGRRSGTPFAASTSTELSIHIQPAQAEDGRGQLSSYTGSLVYRDTMYSTKGTNWSGSPL